MERNKAYRTALHLIGDNVTNLRYLSSLAIPGIYQAMTENYGISRSDEAVEALKLAIYDFVSEHVFGGCEPTFATKESYEWWFALNDASFGERFVLPNVGKIFEE